MDIVDRGKRKSAYERAPPADRSFLYLRQKDMSGPARARKSFPNGLVIWITGLSGSGKSTLCSALFESFQAQGRHVLRLDGDQIREAFGQDLGYDVGSRTKQIGRIQRIARLVADQ